MALARKGSKLISVGGADYRWTVSDDSGHKTVVVQRASGDGQRLEARSRVRPDFRDLVVGPAGVRALIEWAVADGWPADGTVSSRRLDDADLVIESMFQIELKLVLRDEDNDGYHVSFGPLEGVRRGTTKPTDPVDGLVGPITFSGPAGRWERYHSQGLEPDRLAWLRSDLRILSRERSGTVTFDDHDFVEIIRLVGGDRGVAIVDVVPSSEFWNLEFCTISYDTLAEVIAQIDRIETHLGPLTGHCGLCGPGRSRYEPA